MHTNGEREWIEWKRTADEPAVAKAMAGRLQIYVDKIDSQKGTKIENV
jgi:hypothetical protein